MNWYVGAVLGWLSWAMFQGVRETGVWLDPLFIGFATITLAVLAAALDSTVFMRVRGDTLQVAGIFRRAGVARSSSRFVVERVGGSRSGTHRVLLVDGRYRRQISRYWMWGDLLAPRAVARLNRSLLS